MIKEEMTKIQMAIMILIDLYFTIHSRSPYLRPRKIRVGAPVPSSA